MRTRNFLLGAMGLLLMASCAKDEVVSVNRDGDEIAFNVVTNANTRVDTESGGVYCNNNMPDKFYVWATHGGKTYIEGDEIARQSLDIPNPDPTLRPNSAIYSVWKNNSGTRYWPESGEVKFFAHTNAGDKFIWDTNAPTIVDFTVPVAVAEQKDLIYAVKTATKEDRMVIFNFRHALSQVVFRASNPNKNLHVRISGVSICKLGNENTFHYPTDDTDNNISIGHGRENVTDTESNVWGTWDELRGGTTNYSVTFDPVDVPGGEDVKSLTDKNEEGKEYSNNAMLLLPQKTTAWVTLNMAQSMPRGLEQGETGDGDEVEQAVGNPEQQDGTYFRIKCQIWNVAGEAFNEETDICLWGKDGAKDVAIPVELDLKQGKKYIYTFIFNGGGYDPNPDPNDPTPVLQAITFSATVDDFEPVQEETELKEEVLQLLD